MFWDLMSVLGGRVKAVAWPPETTAAGFRGPRCIRCLVGSGRREAPTSSERWQICQLRGICDAECSSQGSGIQVDRTGGRYSTQAWRTGRKTCKHPQVFLPPADRRRATGLQTVSAKSDFERTAARKPPIGNPRSENRTTSTRKPNVWKTNAKLRKPKQGQVKMQSIQHIMD